MEPDVERSIVQSPPPQDANDHHLRLSETEKQSESPASRARPETPVAASEDEAQDPDEKDVELGQTLSTAESVYPPPVKVPRASRRGLFGRFSILAEVEEPKHYSRRTKWFITFIIALAAIAAPLGSAIILRKCASESQI